MPSPLRILHVEDNPADVLLVKMAFKGVDDVELSTFPDGDTALAHLHGHAANDDQLRPDLVLLDLNLPGLDGREVLERLKNNASTRDIPVVVLTSSDSQDDIAAAYRLQAGGYVTKPVGFGPFSAALRGIRTYWREVATLPARPTAQPD